MTSLRLIAFFVLLYWVSAFKKQESIYVYADKQNDLCIQLENEGYHVRYFNAISDLVKTAPHNAGIMILGKTGAHEALSITAEVREMMQRKRQRCYAEFVGKIGKEQLSDTISTLRLERAVISSDQLGDALPANAILGLNRSKILLMPARESLIVTAKVLGFEKAELGLANTPANPLLFFYDKNTLLSTSCLSNFATGRFGPEPLWKNLHEYIISWLIGNKKAVEFRQWLTYVKPMLAKNEGLDEKARRNSIAKGVEWFFNARLFLSGESYPVYKKYETDFPYGPGLKSTVTNGDGSLGILEGHGSIIQHDGRQDYRYWLRNDVQGEVAMTLMLAGEYLGDERYKSISANLTDFAMKEYRQGARNDKKNPNYGLMSWISMMPDVYYGDDNARALLGFIIANNTMKNTAVDRKIVECILANYRTSSRQGYRGSPALSESQLTQNGWKHYFEMDYVNPHPHFESWLWACYLWLYHKTNHQPLLNKARKGIETTMEAYPDRWRWTNGIQQERARMILPLAWLVRVEPSERHLKWLNQMMDDLLRFQVECGAIQEMMGDPSLNFVGKSETNDDYGKHEAALIYRNGDPVSDMLYTTNFAFFALNEAVPLSGNPKHREALQKMNDFLVRIQVSSDKFKDLDGAWFRAFNYKYWNYWADNADNGWGAWCTLSGWIQSWIVSTQILIDRQTTYWDLTKNARTGDCFNAVWAEMIPGN